MNKKEFWDVLRYLDVHSIAQSCPTLCDPMDCSIPGSSGHEIFQARIPEWVSMPSSRGSFQSRDRTCVSSTAGEFFTAEPLGKPHETWIFTCKRMKLDSYLISLTKNNSKWSKDINIRCEMGRKQSQSSLKLVLGMTFIKNISNRSKNKLADYIKLDSFCTTKENQQDGKATNRREKYVCKPDVW